MALDFKSPSQPLSEINVTPLVDVMLVLLVIFMVTAPMFSQGLPVNLPEAKARPLIHDRPLVVTISRDRTLFLGDRQMDLAGLGPALTAQGREPQGLEVLLKSDRDVPYGLVVQVMSTLKEAGVGSLGIIPSPAPPLESASGEGRNICRGEKGKREKGERGRKAKMSLLCRPLFPFRPFVFSPR